MAKSTQRTERGERRVRGIANWINRNCAKDNNIKNIYVPWQSFFLLLYFLLASRVLNLWCFFFYFLRARLCGSTHSPSFFTSVSISPETNPKPKQMHKMQRYAKLNKQIVQHCITTRLPKFSCVVTLHKEQQNVTKNPQDVFNLMYSLIAKSKTSKFKWPIKQNHNITE